MRMRRIMKRRAQFNVAENCFCLLKLGIHFFYQHRPHSTKDSAGVRTGFNKYGKTLNSFEWISFSSLLSHSGMHFVAIFSFFICQSQT